MKLICLICCASRHAQHIPKTSCVWNISYASKNDSSDVPAWRSWCRRLALLMLPPGAVKSDMHIAPNSGINTVSTSRVHKSICSVILKNGKLYVPHVGCVMSLDIFSQCDAMFSSSLSACQALRESHSAIVVANAECSHSSQPDRTHW